MFATGLTMILLVILAAGNSKVRAWVDRSDKRAQALGGVLATGLLLMAVSVILALWRLLP